MLSTVEIAEEMGISRQRVSILLKKALSKVYMLLKNKGLTTEEVINGLLYYLNLTDEKDIKNFISSFSKDIQKEIIYSFNLKACIKCVYCVKTINDTFYCENDFFDNIEFEKICLFTPETFDCDQFEKRNEN